MAMTNPPPKKKQKFKQTNGNDMGLKVQSIEPEKNQTETGLDRKKPDFQLQFDHSMKKKTEKNR